MHAYVHAQVRLTLCVPVICSLPGSSVHEILQTRLLECKTNKHLNYF